MTRALPRVALLIEEIVGRRKISECIAGFERDPFRDCDSAAKTKRFVPTAAHSFVKAIVANSFLQQNPWCLTTQAESVTQAGRCAGADLIERSRIDPRAALRKSAARFKSKIAR